MHNTLISFHSSERSYRRRTRGFKGAWKGEGKGAGKGEGIWEGKGKGEEERGNSKTRTAISRHMYGWCTYAWCVNM